MATISKCAATLPGILEIDELGTGLVSNDDFTSDVWDVRHYGTVYIEIDIDDASAPDYTIDVLGGLRNDIDELRALTLSEGDISAEAGVTLSSGSIEVDGSALTGDARILIALKDHPAYIAIRGTHGGAGTTGERINYRVFARGC